MIADLAGLSATFYVPLSAFAWVVVFKLAGESMFGVQAKKDIKELRTRLHRAITVSLVNIFEPILTLANSVKVPNPKKIILAESVADEESPKITELGQEKLRNAVQDFVKSDVVLMKSLRTLDAADSRITQCLRGLSVWVFWLAITSGFFAVVSLCITNGILVITVDWPFIAAFTVVAAVVVLNAIFLFRMILATNVIAKMKDTHADLQ